MSLKVQGFASWLTENENPPQEPAQRVDMSYVRKPEQSPKTLKP